LYEIENDKVIPIKKKKEAKTKDDKLLKRKNTNVLSDAWTKLRADEEVSSEEDLLVKKIDNQTHLLIDEDGNFQDDNNNVEESSSYDDNFIEKVVEQMKEQDIKDRKVYKEKLKEKRRLKKNY